LKGRFIGSVVRSDVGKVELKWNYLTVQEWANINQLFSGPNNFVREVEFFDQVRGTWTVREMYVSDRSAGIVCVDTRDRRCSRVDGLYILSLIDSLRRCWDAGSEPSMVDNQRKTIVGESDVVINLGAVDPVTRRGRYFDYVV